MRKLCVSRYIRYESNKNTFPCSYAIFRTGYLPIKPHPEPSDYPLWSEQTEDRVTEGEHAGGRSAIS